MTLLWVDLTQWWLDAVFYFFRRGMGSGRSKIRIGIIKQLSGIFNCLASVLVIVRPEIRIRSSLRNTFIFST
jgi:hypothetical protein